MKTPFLCVFCSFYFLPPFLFAQTDSVRPFRQMREDLDDLYDLKLNLRGARQSFQNSKEFNPWVDSLGRALRNSKEEVRLNAAAALRHIGPSASRVTLPLAMGLQDSSAQVRHACASGLFYVGPLASDAVPYLVFALNDPDPKVRIQAVRTLGQIHGQPEKAVPALIRLIESPEQEDTKRFGGIRLAAIRALGKFGPGPETAKAGPALVKAMNDSDPSIRFFAMVNLGMIRAEIKVLKRRCIKLLETSADVQECVGAVDALGYLGEHATDAVPLMTQVLLSPGVEGVQKRQFLRGRIMDALGQMGPHAAEAVPDLISFFKDGKGDRIEYADVIRALGEIREPKHLICPFLVECLNDPNLTVYGNVLNSACRRIGSPIVKDLVDNLSKVSGPARRRTLIALRNVGVEAAEAIPVLEQELKKNPGDSDVRSAMNYIKGPLPPLYTGLPWLDQKE